MARKNPTQIKHARELRKSATPQERKLWYEFLRSYPLRFRRQQPAGPYILDFFCPSARLAIELDGGGHYEPEQMACDQRRSACLGREGIRVLRFTNLEIDHAFTAVCETIDRNISPSADCAHSASAGRGPD